MRSLASLSASESMTDSRDSREVEYTITFDASLAGRRVEADGGSEALGMKHGGREQYEGSLTGRKLSQGDPPWVFLELGDLKEKPVDLDQETVWCDEAYVYFLDE
jgi:hypothetical protein